jgi:hypothetical protein
MVATNSSSPSTMVAANSQWLVSSICCTCNDNKPNISPLRKRKKKEVYFRHRYPKSSFLFPKVISYISIAIEITMYFEEKKRIMGLSENGIPMLLFSSALFPIITISIAVDTINTTQSISHGDVMVSAAGSFKLGFSSPGSSKNRCLDIWYNNVPCHD